MAGVTHSWESDLLYKGKLIIYFIRNYTLLQIIAWSSINTNWWEVVGVSLVGGGHSWESDIKVTFMLNCVI